MYSIYINLKLEIIFGNKPKEFNFSPNQQIVNFFVVSLFTNVSFVETIDLIINRFCQH